MPRSISGQCKWRLGYQAHMCLEVLVVSARHVPGVSASGGWVTKQTPSTHVHVPRSISGWVTKHTVLEVLSKWRLGYQADMCLEVLVVSASGGWVTKQACA